MKEKGEIFVADNEVGVVVGEVPVAGDVGKFDGGVGRDFGFGVVDDDDFDDIIISKEYFILDVV